MEQTFVMVKPDGVQRGLISVVIKSLEEKGYKLAAIKVMNISSDLAQRHYAEHAGKSFFKELIQFITSGPIVAMVWEGRSVVQGVRKILGATNPIEAVPGSLRGSYGVDIGRNIVHGSDSLESARREIGLFFNSEEIIEYQRTMDKWIME